MSHRTLLALVAVALAAGCRRDHDLQAEARALTAGGDPERGHAFIRQYGCGSCHVIPGVDGARGAVGPSLAELRGRMYIAGVLPHTPENLIRWIEDPPKVDSLTAMPNLNIPPHQARDIAAYLYALEH
jgi:cytochrome c